MVTRVNNPKRVSFEGGGAFWSDLKKEVDEYLNPKRKASGYRKLYRKAVLIGIWYLVSYIGLVLIAGNVWQVAVFGASLIFALYAAACGIMHDGNHGAFSSNKGANRAAGFLLDLLGGSSFTWKVKHNRMHHTMPNVDEEDEDIDLPPFARVTSTQEWRPWYQWQHIYLWFFYGLVSLRWQIWGDIVHLKRGRIKNKELNATTRDYIEFGIGKALFLSWVLFLPLALHFSWQGAMTVLVVLLVLSWFFSLLLITTFQLAHCVDEALFSSPADVDERGKLPNKWAIHQVKSTTDFCPDNRLITWLTGGLNFQVVHHLFQHTSHCHYPAIAGLVRDTCRKHNVQYVCHPTLRSALAAHYRHLKNMGRKPQ